MNLPQPISEAVRDLQTQMIPWLPQPDTKLLVTITRSVVPLLWEQRAAGITHEISQKSPAGLQVQCENPSQLSASQRPAKQQSLHSHLSPMGKGSKAYGWEAGIQMGESLRVRQLTVLWVLKHAMALSPVQECWLSTEANNFLFKGQPNIMISKKRNLLNCTCISHTSFLRKYLLCGK